MRESRCENKTAKSRKSDSSWAAKWVQGHRKSRHTQGNTADKTTEKSATGRYSKPAPKCKQRGKTNQPQTKPTPSQTYRRRCKARHASRKSQHAQGNKDDETTATSCYFEASAQGTAKRKQDSKKWQYNKQLSGCKAIARPT